MGWRRYRYGPRSTSSASRGGLGKGESELPIVQPAQTATARPSAATNQPRRVTPGPTNRDAATNTKRTSWAITQRSPLLERDEADVVEPLRPDPLDQLRWRLAVDRERHQRLPPTSSSGHGHVRDVDAGLSEQRPDTADHTRNVVVPDEDDQRRELHLELEAERADQPDAVLAADRRPRDAQLDVVGEHADADKVGEVPGRTSPLLHDFDPTLLCEQRGVDVVHRLIEAPLERAVQCGGRQQARVVIGEIPVVGELDPLGAAGGQLHRQPPELCGERQVGPEHLQIFWPDRGDVDRIRDELAAQGGRNLLGDDDARSVLSLLGRSE